MGKISSVYSPLRSSSNPDANIKVIPNRTRQQDDEHVRQEPYVRAPYIHKNNEPKYHVMLSRAVEYAKRCEDGPKKILWVVAKDDPVHNAEIAVSKTQLEKKRQRFLQFHDQQTAGIPGLLPMYLGLPARVTEKLSRNKNITILKHTPCTVVGWDLDPLDRLKTEEPERMLTFLPRCI